MSNELSTLKSQLINNSGLTLSGGQYTTAYNTDPDTLTEPGLYYCNGVYIEGSYRWGYMLIFMGVNDYIKQIYFQNNNNRVRQRYKDSANGWTDWTDIASA